LLLYIIIYYYSKNISTCTKPVILTLNPGKNENGKIKLTDISHIYPPAADKTLGYATRPFDSIIISKSSSNYNPSYFLDFVAKSAKIQNIGLKNAVKV